MSLRECLLHVHVAGVDLARGAIAKSAPVVLCDRLVVRLMILRGKMGLDGLVSKRLSAPYRSGRSRDWLKVKNPDSPAMIRAREVVW